MKPTVHQASILKAMRDATCGYLTAGKFGMTSPRLHADGSPVSISRRTFDTLRRNGWIARQWRGGCNGDYGLTAAGRAALYGPERANARRNASGVCSEAGTTDSEAQK